MFRDEAQWPPDMTYSLWVYFGAYAPFVLTGSSNGGLIFWYTMIIEHLLQSIWCPWSNGWRCLRCLFSTFCLAHHSITISRLTWRLELACKNTMRVLNYRVSLSTNTSKMNLSVVLVKSRHLSSFVFGLCRKSSETSELIILSIDNLHSTLYIYSPFTLLRHAVQNHPWSPILRGSNPACKYL